MLCLFVRLSVCLFHCLTRLLKMLFALGWLVFCLFDCLIVCLFVWLLVGWLFFV